MRTFKTFFLPFCFCVLALVVSLTTFAGNGVERGTGWIEWTDVSTFVQPEMQEAVENSIQIEAPQLIAALESEGEVLIVDSVKAVGGSSGLSGSSQKNAPIVELTLRRSSDEKSRFKVRMEMEYPQGFMSYESGTDLNRAPVPSAKILDWIGLEAVFGTNFGLKNAR